MAKVRPVPPAAVPLALLRERADAVALTEAMLAEHGLPVQRDLHEALVRNSEIVRRQIIMQFGYVPSDPVTFAREYHAHPEAS